VVLDRRDKVDRGSVGLFRFAAFDLEGTLVDSTGRVFDGVVAGLAQLTQRGVTLIVMTGRSAPGFRHAAEIAERHLFDVFHQGVLVDAGDSVLDRRSDEITCTAVLPTTTVEQLRAVAADLVIGACGRLFASSRRAAAAYAMAYRLPRRLVEMAEPVGPVTRVTVFGDSPTMPGTIMQTIDPFGATVYAPANGGKEAGLSAFLAATFGESSLDSVIAFGDADNDAGVLAACGAGVAAPGSSPAAVAAASHHVPESLADFLVGGDLRAMFGV
jgi:hypothetical protein